MSKLILLLLWRKIKGFRCSLPVNVCKNTFCFTFFIVFHNLFSQGHRFTNITCTGSICNHSLKCGCHFSTLDINAHFRILFIAKFEFLKLHSNIRSFERMFKFNQVRLGPSTYIHTINHSNNYAIQLTDSATVALAHTNNLL